MDDGIVSYGEHPLNRLKFFQFDKSNDVTLLLIHGGAWRDPNNTYNDFKDMISHIQKNQYAAKYNLIAMNYRLSPEVKHPFHLWDVLEGLQFLVQNYDIHKISIAGHSVGATLMLQLLDYNKILDTGFQILVEDSKADKNRTETDLHVPSKKERILMNEAMEKLQLRTFCFIDGIYDITQLISEYGCPYESFVNNAFSSPEQYAEATQLSSSTVDVGSPFSYNTHSANVRNELNLVILQSNKDELLSMRQTNLFIEYLTQKNLNFKPFVGEWGGHEHVYRHEDVANIVLDSI
ncbi:DEHA2D04422p [Debaryomyces hansenii CBS767]|uniref:Kynurenine formamidase n=1 Tax=Debaryomyces hansenii (strain ATCC 36239 / CBS 767 / BCRC 21394 / JCM 1990 / NBRC 0083 / IGC 2968) TaxID=284592 RepID=KFA_DEBHA|nr:DEHA2D04422p [Debaryomyces hansenii CBS767]Q6BT11.2 RecName: Full=Kynurenine formamidase; Short=KFA; Short=KFase; AltName: Full=Arylformamidase; AltName: Full=N-formylkynurenine formamidase; Short=FKF [Debaryomyces hansenii CBS767]CAG86798.2 DEHA2D04422p [Debaryomyces hansenii CBS767]|eukprot:XP_458659.2 DEHA2D04422p [Debaryomyces hansenii CBS767]